ESAGPDHERLGLSSRRITKLARALYRSVESEQRCTKGLQERGITAVDATGNKHPGFSLASEGPTGRRGGEPSVGRERVPGRRRRQSRPHLGPGGMDEK